MQVGSFDIKVYVPKIIGYHNDTHIIMKLSLFTYIFNGPYMNGAYKYYITAKRGTPVVPKKYFSKKYIL